MAAVNNISVPILEANNYNNLEFRMKLILKRENCSEALKDPPEITATVEVRNKFNKEDTRAQSIIVQGISDKHLDMIKDCKTAKEQLEKLKGVFVRTSSFTKLSLWRKQLNLKHGGQESLEDHFLKFETIIKELKDQGSSINGSDEVCHLLLSLPSKYNTVVTALETISDVKIDFVKSRLLDEEIKLYSKGESGDRQTRKSISGFVGFHAGNPIAWHSRKQNCVAMSSMEAGYVSAGLAAQELLNLKGILSEFGESGQTTLKIDNLSAISLVKNFENSKRSKHI